RPARTTRPRVGGADRARQLRRDDLHRRVQFERSPDHRLLRSKPRARQLPHGTIGLLRRRPERIRQPAGRGLRFVRAALTRSIKSLARPDACCDTVAATVSTSVRPRDTPMKRSDKDADHRFALHRRELMLAAAAALLPLHGASAESAQADAGLKA